MAIAEQFIQRLQSAEKTGDVRSLCELFSENALCENLTRHNSSSHHAHKDAPTQFWRQYLAAFREIQSRFGEVTSTDRTAVLEWRSSGFLPMGLPIDYSGVTIFDFENGKISKLRTYYDSAAFMPHSTHNEPRYSSSVGRPEINTSASS